MNPFVSIIVPVYGVEQYLYKCINSLVNQTLKDIEIILVDDKSPDACPMICDEWAKKDSRIKVVHRKENGGLGYTRNTGLEVATGEYVTFVDSDDFVENECYKTVYEKCKEKGLDACFFQYKKINQNGKVFPESTIKKEYIFESTNGLSDLFLIMLGNVKSSKVEFPQIGLFVSVCMALYKRSIIELYSLQFKSERIMASEDLLFQMDFLPKSKKIGVLPNDFYFWYYNDNSISTSYNDEKLNRFLNLLNYLKETLPSSYNNVYVPYFKSYSLTILKTILRYESVNKISFLDRCRRINRICGLDLCKNLYGKPYRVFNSHKDTVIVYCMKYRLSFMFVIFYNFFYKGYK